MFKFKKLTAIALVAVAAMGLLAGCGSEKSKNDTRGRCVTCRF